MTVEGGRTDERTNGQTDKQPNGQIDKQAKRTNGQINKSKKVKTVDRDDLGCWLATTGFI